ncbi:MAG: transcription termination/antitermination NusG family protein [Candidatus Acidiferrum sp.]
MSLRSQQWPWFALLVRASREKTATLFLENSGYQCYLPLSKLTRRWSDRLKAVEVPLFPGYLFCRMDPGDRLGVLMAPGVIQIVGVGRTPLPVDENEILALQRAATNGISMTPWPYMKVGQMARIEAGPLKGLTGIVVRIKSGMKLVLSVSLLQRSVAVEIDRAWLSEPFEPAPAPRAITNARSNALRMDPTRLNAKQSRSIAAAEAD